MAKELDLEEQEQLDQIKHFWKQYGNPITWVLIAMLAGYAGWNGYHYWQRTQSSQASALYGELERLAAQGDPDKVQRAFADMKDKFGSTTFAMQAGLLTAKIQQEAGKPELALAALTWVADEASDPAYQAIAGLRLSAALAQSKDYSGAMARLDGKFPAAFAALVADRKGDLLMLQDKPAEARAQYEQAYKGFDAQTDYRRLVEIKLTALGADPRPQPDAAATAEGKK